MPPAESRFATTILALLSAALSPAAARAQATPAPPQPAPAATPAPPPCASPAHHQFDFWLGEWEVFRPDGQRAGGNRIVSALGGCALHESWTSAAGNRGESFTAWEPNAGVWHQTWVDDSGLLLRLDGGIEEGAMVLRGEQPTWGREGLFAQEIRWTPLPGGGVQQTGRLSEDGGKTWAVLFDLTYRRVAAASAGDAAPTSPGTEGPSAGAAPSGGR